MRQLLFILFACLLFLLAACTTVEQKTETPIVTVPAAVVVESPAVTPEPDPWTSDEVEAIARTLSGECYEDKPNDKRLVAEVILNRTSDGRWGNTVTEVVIAKSQFHGYWKPSRDISNNDREIATEALHDWYANDCKALSDYLFFEAGPNRENVFRQKY